MMLIIMEHGGNWDFLGRIFKIKGRTFERMVMKIILVGFYIIIGFNLVVKDVPE